MAQDGPFGFPARFADSFGLAQDRSGGGANSLRSDNALPCCRSRLHSSATPKAIEIKKGKKILEFHWSEEKMFGTIVNSACETCTRTEVSVVYRNLA